VAVQVAEPAALPQAQPVAQQPLLPKVAAAWAVQVLAGPAYTYRSLGTKLEQTSVAGASPSPAPNVRDLSMSQRSTAELEHPGPGLGAQVSLSRRLGNKWAASAGLGYAEYASRLDMQLVYQPNSYVISSVPTQPDSARPVHRRDTYRFVTVPLRLSYTWALSARWRVGLQAGAEAALYLGGTTTEGSACACQTQSWSASGSPYRRLSLGASAGADLRYRVSERWELLAQPTGTLMLTPLAKEGSGYYSRHLFGATALFGAAFDLR